MSAVDSSNLTQFKDFANQTQRAIVSSPLRYREDTEELAVLHLNPAD
jgi:hypothetical protein